MNSISKQLASIILMLCFPFYAHASEKIVTDSFGGNRVLSVPIRKIVSLSASGVECLRIMGRLDTLVGITEHIETRSKQLPEIKGIPSVGRGFMPNLEAIAELRPDLVLAWKTNPGPELERQLGPFGITVLRLDLTEPKRLPEEMRALASLLGAEAQSRTEAYLNWLAYWTDRIQKSIADYPRPTVLAEHFTSFKIAGPGSGLYDLTQMAGGNNLAADIGVRAMQVDSEWIIERNPQFFIKCILLEKQDIQKDMQATNRCLLTVSHRNNWNLLDAVRNNRIYIIDSDVASGPQYIIGLIKIASYFYPFASIPAEEKIYEDINNKIWLKENFSFKK